MHGANRLAEKVAGLAFDKLIPWDYYLVLFSSGLDKCLTLGSVEYFCIMDNGYRVASKTPGDRTGLDDLTIYSSAVLFSHLNRVLNMTFAVEATACDLISLSYPTQLMCHHIPKGIIQLFRKRHDGVLHRLTLVLDIVPKIQRRQPHHSQLLRILQNLINRNSACHHIKEALLRLLIIILGCPTLLVHPPSRLKQRRK